MTQATEMAQAQAMEPKQLLAQLFTTAEARNVPVIPTLSTNVLDHDNKIAVPPEAFISMLDKWAFSRIYYYAYPFETVFLARYRKVWVFTSIMEGLPEPISRMTAEGLKEFEASITKLATIIPVDEMDILMPFIKVTAEDFLTLAKENKPDVIFKREDELSVIYVFVGNEGNAPVAYMARIYFTT